MAVWKQLLLGLAVLVAAAGVWAFYFPGAPAILARYGIDIAQAAPETDRQQTAATGESGSRRQGGREGGGASLVVAAPATSATINDRLQAIGTGRAKASVTVNPYATGRLIEIVAKSGSKISKGNTIAFLDSDAETIALDRAKVGVQDAQSKYDRARQLRASNTTTAVAVTDAEVALRNATLAEREAQLDLDRRSIMAPIDGVIGILPLEVGNYVNAQSVIATIDDRSSILVDFWVPERFAGMVEVGAAVSAAPISNKKEMLSGTVTAIDNRIDEKSRTMWVQATVANPNDTLRAGMSFEVEVRFPGQTFPAVSPLAIQWGTDGAFIWTVTEGKAKRVPVRIVQRNTQDVLVEAAINTGDLIVTEGVQSMRDGGDVRVAGANPVTADGS